MCIKNILIKYIVFPSQTDALIFNQVAPQKSTCVHVSALQGL